MRRKTKTKVETAKPKQEPPTLARIAVWQLNPGRNDGPTHLRGHIMREVITETREEATWGVETEVRQVQRKFVTVVPASLLGAVRAWLRTDEGTDEDGGLSLVLRGETRLPRDLEPLPCPTCGR